MANEPQVSIAFTVQQEPTSRGHYWTATLGEFDGAGHDREAALFDLVNTLYEALELSRGR